MSDTKRPADDFWAKFEWEGGIGGAVEYGLDAAEYDLPQEVVDAWDRLVEAYHAFDRYVPEFEGI